MTELYLSHMEVGERIEHTRYQQLREHDHRPTYQEVRTVDSESDDHTYLVAKVACLNEPFDPDETDIAADRIYEVPLCGCDDSWYRGTGDFEIGENPPSEWASCKHYRREFRAVKARADESQQELGK